MKICGIIAEYNPFHNGHLYHIEETRKLSATHIACVMSGSFVQRGDIAILDKWERARLAVLSGADLVVELPVCYSLASAATFARAGVYILSCLNASLLSFGSECGDIDVLVNVAKATEHASGSDILWDKLKSGVSYPTALKYAVDKLYSKEYGEVLNSANNTLAIEYINAISSLRVHITPMTILRSQVEHDSSSSGSTISSASHIRSLVNTSDSLSITQYLNEECATLLNNQNVTLDAIMPMLMYKLKTMSVSDFALLPDVSEGLENRLYRCAQQMTSIEEFLTLTKTKRYTLARIRRIMLCALLGITKLHQDQLPQYARVLALNTRGQEILAQCRKSSPIPIATKFKTLYDTSPFGINCDLLSTDLFNLAKSVVQKSGEDFLRSPIQFK